MPLISTRVRRTVVRRIHGRLRLAAVTIVCVAPLIGASDVFGHVVVMPDRIEADGLVDLTFDAPNEHDAPMEQLEVELPQGSVVVEARNPGWSEAVTPDSVTWSGRRVASDGSVSIRLRIRAPEQPGRQDIWATQRYIDGHSDRWALSLDVTRRTRQNLLAAAIVGVVGVALTVGFVVIRARSRSGST